MFCRRSKSQYDGDKIDLDTMQIELSEANLGMHDTIVLNNHIYFSKVNSVDAIIVA